MIKDILREHNLYLEKNRDQLFLDDEEILEKEVEEAEVGKDDVILEIGAGVGNLTKKIAEKARKVYAIEKDEDLIFALKAEMENFDNLEIIHRDALEVEFPDFDKCVSNIPYSISSEIIEKLSNYGRLSILTLQREFAERLVAEPGSGDYSRITILARLYFLPVILQEISRDKFFPKPDVDSSLVKLFPREKDFELEDEEFFFEVVKSLFVHKKKKVRNSFYNSRHFFGLDKKKARSIRDKIPNSEKRVFELNLKELMDISTFLKSSLD